MVVRGYTMVMKDQNPVALLGGHRTLPIVEAYYEFNHLKQLYRQGWLQRGMPPKRCESVAEHTFGMAVLCMFLVDSYYPDLDRLKVLRMALLHDFGEIHAGDITPSDQVDAHTKYALERESVQQVLSRLPEGTTYLSLWQEYEDNASAEARFVKQIDRLEMALQAGIYQQQSLVNASDFMSAARRVVDLPELQVLLNEAATLVKS